MLPRGQITDLGDIYREVRYIIKGRHLTIGFHAGAPRERPDGWEPTQETVVQDPTGKAIFAMDLKADQEFDLSPVFKDEMGNVTAVPADANVTYTASTDEFVELIDLGNGSVTVGALGTLGSTDIHSSAMVEGREATGDMQVVTVPGNAERMELVAGEPRERTPDA